MRSPAEIALSLGVVALGLGVAGVTATLPSEGGYAGIGPNFIPAVVAAGIIAARRVARRRGVHRRLAQARPSTPRRFARRAVPLGERRAVRPHGADWPGPASSSPARCCSPAWRAASAVAASRAISRIALVLTLGIYLFFVKLLNVGLPAGWLAPLLGGAGI